MIIAWEPTKVSLMDTHDYCREHEITIRGVDMGNTVPNFILMDDVIRYIVRWLNKKIVTRWIKAPNFAHVFFRCLSNILEGGARATTTWSG